MTSNGTDHGLWFLNNHVTVALSKADNHDGISVLRMQMPCGEAPPVHVHHAEDEVFHILRGQLRFRLGDRRVTAEAGDTVLAPRGVPHGFRVLSADGAEVLTVTRGGFEDMVRDVARPATAPVLPEAAAPSPEMQAVLARRCAARQIELLGPPID